MVSKGKGKVFVLLLVPPDQFDMQSSNEDLIKSNLQSGKSVKRYGRDWIIGGAHTDRLNIFRGRIGLRGEESTVEIWNDETKDFTETAVPEGIPSHFAIDLRSLRLAVQVRSSRMDLGSMIGAFRDLLSAGGNQWKIENPKNQMTLPEWRRKVIKVVSVRFSVKKPNPHYRDTPDLQALLESSEAINAFLELKNENGLNIDSSFVSESQSHVESGYGQSVYKGIKPDGELSVYNSELGSEEVPHEVNTNEAGEVTDESFTEILSQE